jgi:hypothetical protein
METKQELITWRAELKLQSTKLDENRILFLINVIKYYQRLKRMKEDGFRTASAS